MDPSWVENIGALFGHGAGIFANICPKDHPVMWLNIPAPWILWDREQPCHFSRGSKKTNPRIRLIKFMGIFASDKKPREFRNPGISKSPKLDMPTADLLMVIILGLYFNLIGGLEHDWYFSIWNNIIPTDELIFFRGLAKNHHLRGQRKLFLSDRFCLPEKRVPGRKWTEQHR